MSHLDPGDLSVNYSAKGSISNDLMVSVSKTFNAKTTLESLDARIKRLEAKVTFQDTINEQTNQKIGKMFEAVERNRSQMNQLSGIMEEFVNTRFNSPTSNLPIAARQLVDSEHGFLSSLLQSQTPSEVKTNLSADEPSIPAHVPKIQKEQDPKKQVVFQRTHFYKFIQGEKEPVHAAKCKLTVEKQDESLVKLTFEKFISASKGESIECWMSDKMKPMKMDHHEDTCMFECYDGSNFLTATFQVCMVKFPTTEEADQFLELLESM